MDLIWSVGQAEPAHLGIGTGKAEVVLSGLACSILKDCEVQYYGVQGLRSICPDHSSRRSGQ
jgi:hypothetical protein